MATESNQMEDEIYQDDYNEEGQGMVEPRALHQIMDIALEPLRQTKDWQSMPEQDQQKVIDRLDKRLGGFVCGDLREYMEVNGRTAIACALDSITVKDGFKITLSAAQLNSLRHDLVDAQGTRVLLVLPNAPAARAFRWQHDHNADPDNNELEFGQ